MPLLFELFLTFAKIGTFTFGGGYAMISLLDHTCVEQKKWLTSEEFSDLTVIAESTPGPIAINCSTYTGYKKAGFSGAIAATLGMIFPSFLILLTISFFFENILSYPLIANAFRGIRVAVSLLIFRAGAKMVKKMLKNSNTKTSSLVLVLVFFTLSFCLTFFNIPISTIWLILAAGVAGFLLYGHKRKEAGK
ncbi:MAG: chromate transporter [Ruminococcaceae bacterium]|nr:chromate transporter [Oscillospiraceae bacterium]